MTERTIPQKARELSLQLIDTLNASNVASINEASRDSVSFYIEATLVEDRNVVAAFYRGNIRRLAQLVGWQENKCKSCQASIYWATTEGGRLLPVDVDGRAHFASCPDADKHRKRKS